MLVGSLDPRVCLGDGPWTFPNLVCPSSSPNFMAFWAVRDRARGPTASRYPFGCPNACFDDGGQHPSFPLPTMALQVLDLFFTPGNVGPKLHTFTMEVSAGLFPEELLKVFKNLFPDLVFEELAARVKFPNCPIWALPFPWLQRIPTQVQEDSNQIMNGPDYSPPPGEGVQESMSCLLPSDVQGHVLHG